MYVHDHIYAIHIYTERRDTVYHGHKLGYIPNTLISQALGNMRMRTYQIQSQRQSIGSWF